MNKCKQHPKYKAVRKPTTKKKCGCFEAFLREESARLSARVLEDVKRRLAELKVEPSSKPAQFAANPKDNPTVFDPGFVERDHIHADQRALMRHAGFSAIARNAKFVTWTRSFSVGNFERQAKIALVADQSISASELASLIFNSGVFAGDEFKKR